MPVSKADQRAVAKYVKNNYDRIEVKVAKGKKADIQSHAEQRGESLNAFANRAFDNQIAQDKAVGAFTVQPTSKEDADEKT